MNKIKIILISDDGVFQESTCKEIEFKGDIPKVVMYKNKTHLLYSYTEPPVYHEVIPVVCI